MLAIRKLSGGRPQLPIGMKGTEIMDRYADAKAAADGWRTMLEEAYRFTMPGRNTYLHQAPGSKRNLDIFDSTAVLGVPAFATRMQATILPPWRDYSQLTMGPDTPQEVRDNVRIKRLLKNQTDIYFSHVHHSNMASQIHEAFQDLAIGTGAFDILGGKLGGKALNHNAIPLPELSLEEGPNSTIETSYRDLSVKVSLIPRQWEGVDLPDELVKMLKDSPGTKVPLVEAVIFDPQTGRWEGAVIWKAKKRVIWRANWRTNPRIVFRWSVQPGEIIGRGPILQVLPDIKTANKVVEFILREAALQVSGMWTSVTDSALNPYNFKVVPGGVVPVESNSRDNPTLRALERSGNMQLGFEVLSQLQNVIKTALFQHLRDPSDPVRSATEIAIDDRELVNQSGSSFGRLQTEVVEQSVIRGVDLLTARGAMADIEIDGRQIGLKHTSPLARVQDMDDLITLERTLASIPEESVASGIKIEDLAGYVAGLTGLDPSIVRDENEKAALKEQAAALIQQEQEAAAA